MKKVIINFLVLIFFIILCSGSVYALTPEQESSTDPVVRIKDITRVDGVSTKQLIGYGLVVGLDGTGDGGSQQTIQAVANMMQEFGMQVAPEDMDTDNVASVMVTAEVPTSARADDKIDVTLSSIGAADSLQGGTLLMSPLLGPEREERYGRAQGTVSVGGYEDGGFGGGGDNHSTVARVPNGGTMESSLQGDTSRRDEVTLVLSNPDFTTAQRITDVVNNHFGYTPQGQPYARAEDQGAVRVQIPSQFENNRVGFISRINQLEVRPDSQARVVFNERTGTIVMGHNVRLSKVSIAHGDLTVTVAEGEEEEELAAEDELAPDDDPLAEEEEDLTEEQAMVMPKGSTIADVVEALNAVGADPQDMIAILQAIDEAGGLHADLEIM